MEWRLANKMHLEGGKIKLIAKKVWAIDLVKFLYSAIK